MSVCPIRPSARRAAPEMDRHHPSGSTARRPIRRRRVFLLAALALALSLSLTVPFPAAAQRTSAPLIPDAAPSGPPASILAGFRADANRPSRPGDLSVEVASVAAAALGTLGGAAIGYHLDRNVFSWDGGDDPGIHGFLAGWFMGGAVATPLVAHLVNGRTGSLPSAYLASSLIGGLGMVGLYAVGSPTGVVFLFGAPFAQAVSASMIERRTTP
jgi:hypothetical protein